MDTATIAMGFVGLVLSVLILKFIEGLLRRPYVANITDKYVLVTGCDSGFGNKLAKQLEKLGVHVFAACLTAKGQKELESQTTERVITLRLDVMDHGSILSAFEFVKDNLPPDTGLWGVVNNAGIMLQRGLFEWCTREDYERVIGVNLIGVVDVTLVFMPLLKKANGRVVNVSSAFGRFAVGNAGYAESKFGVQAFSDTLRRDRQIISYGIGISIIEPGSFKTILSSPESMFRNSETAWERLPPEKKAEFPPDLHEKVSQGSSDVARMTQSPRLYLVTDAMEHALFARWPKTRYSCGWDMKLLLPLSYAPAWLVDGFIRVTTNALSR